MTQWTRQTAIKDMPDNVVAKLFQDCYNGFYVKWRSHPPGIDTKERVEYYRDAEAILERYADYTHTEYVPNLQTGRYEWREVYTAQELLAWFVGLLDRRVLDAEEQRG